MTYELKNIIEMVKIYHKTEIESRDLLFLASFPTKNKENLVKIAKSTLVTIEEYKKLPLEVRNELEKDNNTNVSKIVEIEKLCKESILKNKL